MQTIYYTTEHFIRHEGNVVDLEAYRRKLALAGSRGSRSAPLAREMERPEEEPRTEEAAPARPAKERRRGLADWLEMTATLTVAAVAITICVQFVI